jgi:hypothetical protein
MTWTQEKTVKLDSGGLLFRDKRFDDGPHDLVGDSKLGLRAPKPTNFILREKAHKLTKETFPLLSFPWRVPAIPI